MTCIYNFLITKKFFLIVLKFSYYMYHFKALSLRISTSPDRNKNSDMSHSQRSIYSFLIRNTTLMFLLKFFRSLPNFLIFGHCCNLPKSTSYSSFEKKNLLGVKFSDIDSLFYHSFNKKQIQIVEL